VFQDLHSCFTDFLKTALVTFAQMTFITNSTETDADENEIAYVEANQQCLQKIEHTIGFLVGIAKYSAPTLSRLEKESQMVCVMSVSSERNQSMDETSKL
jgi:hypothetical protein